VLVSFRAKLISIVVATTVAFAAVLAVITVVGVRQVRDLDDVQGRMVPKLEVGPRLHAQFGQLRQSMQDAVAAQDAAALDDSVRLRNELVRTIASAGAALRPDDAAILRDSVTAYHDAAYGASRRLLRGESGESLVDELAAMQVQQRATEALMDRAARLDKGELAGGFAAVRKGVTKGTRYALVIGLVALLPVLLLSSWVGRTVFRTLANISSGVSRFATGNFETAIPITTDDELGQVTREVNSMAASLRRADWLKAGRVALAEELRGELAPEEVAERALEFLCARTRAVGGVLHLVSAQGLRPAAFHAPDGREGEPRTFRLGEGLPGRAAERDEITIVTELPEGYFTVRSGLGESQPRSLAFLPLTRGDRRLGVFEFALFEPLDDDAKELYVSVSETIAIALDVAESRARLRELLEESQRLSEQLASQEEELRGSNRELSEQQEELKRANEELEQQRHALSTQNAELIRVREGLVEKAHELAQVSSYKSQFLANMSHELRTPLNSMLLLSHLLSENETKNLTTKQVEFAKTIHGAGTDLLELINQVLDLAKIEAGRQDVVLEDVPITELFERLTRLFRPSAQNKGLELVVELEQGLPEHVTTDRQRIERILVNLVGNALKFTERGRVTLRAARHSASHSGNPGRALPVDGFALSVSDTGIGVPKAAQERIFAPFEQADAGVGRRYSGTGLGLAIARESALLLGGDLVLESVVGKGSTFTCYLPERPATGRTEVEPRPDRATPAPAAPHVEPVSDDRDSLVPGEAYLLVVEDDRVFAEQLVELIRARRIKAVVASNGKEALATSREQRPRGIVLDVNLPDIDGWTVMEELKRDPATRSIPVHIISGADAPKRALSLGAVGYLRKPANKREVIDAIRTLMRPPAVDSSRVLVVEDDPSQGGSIVALLASGGLGAEHVGSAADALAALERERFGCVVLDLGLPDMDGLGLLEKLRTHPVLVMPPVVVHTGRTLTREETRRIEAYAEAVVLKDGHSAERLLDEVRLFVQHVKGDGDASRVDAGSDPLPEISLEGVRILVADDDMRTAYALSALLRGKGADVVVAETGKEALDRLAAEPGVRLVLMDMMMPEMDGYEALKRLRADPRFAQLPAIALTAKAMKDERERCLSAGASDYLAKPVTPARLLTTVRAWLEPKARHGA
jgi:CheY-like chemotaxis protein/signal transduction histidine kinase/HAMP domain-containing protein